MKNISIIVNGDYMTQIVAGSENTTLNVYPLINSHFSFLYDFNCTVCARKNYNSSGKWAIDGKSQSKSLNSVYGNVMGKSVRDSFCLSAYKEACYSNKTEDHYEFFAVQNSSTP